MLDDDGREDCSEYLRQWKNQLIAYPVAATVLFALIRLLVRIEHLYCQIANVDRIAPLESLQRIVAIAFMIVLVTGPIYLYLRRPSKYIQSYVRTMNHEAANGKGQ